MLTKERERLETPFKRRSDSPNTNKHLNPLNRAETGTPISLLIQDRWFMKLYNPLCPVHTSTEGFENGGFTLKTHQLRNLKTQQSRHRSFWICVWGKFGQENHSTWLSWGHRFQKAPFSKCFPSTENFEKTSAFLNSSSFKSVFLKFRFLYGRRSCVFKFLGVWTLS